MREKDGLWAVLAARLAAPTGGRGASAELVTVQSIGGALGDLRPQLPHAYDYEGVDKAQANAMFDAMRGGTEAAVGRSFGAYTIATADDFTYVDPVDGSVAKKQGMRFLMKDGSRIIFRLSGTAGSGATVRMYLEKYEPPSGNTKQVTADVMGELVAFALQLSELKKFCGVETPTVIT